MIERSLPGVRRAVIDHLKPPYVPAEMWLAALAVTTGTNLMDFAVTPLVGQGGNAPLIVAAVLRVIAIFWIAFAVVRRMAGVARPFAPGMPLLRYLALTLVLAIGFGLFAQIANVAAGAEAEMADAWVAHILACAIWYAFTIGLLAWQAALAVGDGGFRLKGLFARQQGALAPLWLAYVALILPFAAIHAALTLIAAKLALPTNAIAALALVDGAVSAVQLVGTCALAVVAWKLASPLREGAAAR